MEQIKPEQARQAMEAGDFGADIIEAADRVAVILTQGWCPQWKEMKSFLAGYSGGTVFYLEYDHLDFFHPFRSFKEAKYGNDQIPYIRYYRGGKLVAESNAVPEQLFRAKLEG